SLASRSLAFVLLRARAAPGALVSLPTRRSSDLISARERTLLGLFRNAFTVVLSVLVFMLVLSQIGVNIAPLLAGVGVVGLAVGRSEEHTSELQSRENLVCRLLLEKKKAAGGTGA